MKDEKQLIEFTESSETVTSTKAVKSDCNSITIINTGTTQATVNSAVLNPGDQYISQGNNLEINRTVYNIAYTGAGVQEVTIIRKTYR
jgi:hypothetical protein